VTNGGEWLRARGIGRERFAGYLASYLETIGYTVERSESAEPSESRIVARLTKMNPAVPASAQEIRFRCSPTSGGAALVWEFPSEVADPDRSRMDRLVRELVLHLERAILTESHATAKVTKAPDARLPWEPPRAAGAVGA
jgi:hypothetical protein